MRRAPAHHVLVVADSVVVDVLRAAGFAVVEAEMLAAAEHELARVDVALVVADAAVGGVAVERLRRAALPARLGLVGDGHAEAAFVLPRPLVAEELIAAVSRELSGPPLPPVWLRVVHAYFDALSHREWDALVELCCSEVTYELPGEDPLGRRLMGRAALRAHVEEAFAGFPGASFVVEEVLPAPRLAVARYRATWWTPQGVARIAGAVCFQFDGEQIASIGVRLDMARARRGVTAGDAG